MSVKIRLRRLEESRKATDEVSYWIRVNAEAKAWIKEQVKPRAEHDQSKNPTA